MAAKKKVEEQKDDECCCGDDNKTANRNAGVAGGGAVYGLGLIGALIYFISHATSFWIGVLGVLKSIVWPILVVYKLLEFLKLTKTKLL